MAINKLTPKLSLDGIWRGAYGEDCGSPVRFADVAHLPEIEAAVPGTMESDMEKAGVLPEIFRGENVLLTQDVENCHYCLSRIFDYEPGDTDDVLVFEGLDCFADIFIDGEFYKGKNSYYRCRFTIWGRPDPSGNSYKLVSEVKETIPIPEMVYRKDKDMKYVVYDDEEYQTSKGQEGYIVDVYRVTVDKNGNEVSREKAYTDTYKAVAPVTYVGITPRPTPEPEPTPEFSID